MDNLNLIKILNKYDVNTTNIKINSANIENIIDFSKFKFFIKKF
jgi:translation elongation factor EF-4